MGGQNAGIILLRRKRRVYNGSVHGVFLCDGGHAKYVINPHGVLWGVQMKHDGVPYGELCG